MILDPVPLGWRFLDELHETVGVLRSRSELLVSSVRSGVTLLMSLVLFVYFLLFQL